VAEIAGEAAEPGAAPFVARGCLHRLDAAERQPGLLPRFVPRQARVHQLARVFLEMEFNLLAEARIGIVWRLVPGHRSSPIRPTARRARG
jgi:hypothetical protein